MPDAEIEVPLPPSETLDILRRAVGQCGGVWSDEETDSAEFAVPTRAGIREGYTRLRPLLEATAGGCRLRLRVVSEVLKVNTAAAVVLLFGAVGGIVVVIWPLHAALLALAPVGAVLALVAWLLVASRSRSYGPEELLGLVGELAEDPEQSAPD